MDLEFGPVESAVGLDGTDRVPALTPDEAEEIGCGIPAIEQHVDVCVRRQIRLEFFQHLPGELQFAAEDEPALLGTLAVEAADRLSTQVRPPGEGVAAFANVQAAGE